jgi:hypothetical protein
MFYVRVLKGLSPIHAVRQVLHDHLLLVIAASLLGTEPLNGLRTRCVQGRIHSNLQDTERERQF